MVKYFRLHSLTTSQSERTFAELGVECRKPTHLQVLVVLPSCLSLLYNPLLEFQMALRNLNWTFSYSEKGSKILFLLSTPFPCHRAVNHCPVPRVSVMNLRINCSSLWNTSPLLHTHAHTHVRERAHTHMHTHSQHARKKRERERALSWGLCSTLYFICPVKIHLS